MLSKARIKQINQLKQKKQRELQGMFLVEGSINVTDFLKSRTGLVELFATDNWLQSINITNIPDYKTTIVSPKELSKISSLKSSPQVLAIFYLPQKSNSINKIETNSLVIALDGISNPGNLGTIIRTADWFGIKCIYCSKNTVDAYNPKVVQASMGSLARIKIMYTDLEILFKNKPTDLPIFGAVLVGSPINKIGKQKNGVILVGSEAHGISGELLPYITHKITIPTLNNDATNKLESLNASVANAIICYALTAT